MTDRPHPITPQPPPEHPTEPPAATRGDAASPDLGAAVAAGANWMILTALLAKASGVIAQVVLGWILSQSDFGVYGAAIGIAAFAQMFRDGGVRNLLVQRGNARYQGLAGPSFWFALTANTIAGALMLAAALAFDTLLPKGDSALADPRFPAVLAVIGLSMVLSSPGVIFLAKLSIDMEFKKLARLKVIAAFARSGSMILFALAGLGPLSFALPLIVYALCQTIIGYILVRDTLWTRRPRFRMWPAIFARTKWLLIAAMALAAFSQGDYLVLGFTVTAETLGLYFFAFQLALQIHQLLGHNLGMVLFPALTRLQDQPARLRNATLRAIRMLACIGAAASAALAAVAEPLEALVWRGNWHAAVPAIQIMGLLFVFRLLLPILQSLLWSRGQFAKLAGLGTGLAAGLMTATAVAGLAFPTPAGIALTVCAFFAVGVTAALAIAVKPIGITPKQLVSAIVIPWLPAAAAAALALATDRFLLTPATESLPQPGAAAARVAALAALYAATLAVTVRLAMPGTTAELLNLCPAKLRPTMRTIARINPPNRNAT